MNSLGSSVMQSLKPFQCPNCNCSYSSKENTKFHNAARFPRILTCCHSACENCLQIAEKKKSFSCTICHEKVDLDDEDPLAKLLPDFYALGIISATIRNSIPSIKVKMVPSNTLKRSANSLTNLGSSIICGHCKTNSASWRCDECELNFCSICFKENHNSTSKKRHEGKKIFADLYNSMVQEGCPEHENKTVEFYCEVDNKLTCSYCMLIGNHLGHEVKTLVDKNKSCAEDLRTALEDICSVQKQLKYTDHLICEEIPKEKIDITDTTKQIRDYFHKLHAALQIRENELISEFKEISQQNVKKLEDMRLKVTHYENDLACLKKDAESVIENPCLAISAPALLKKFEESKNLPCYLVPLNESEANPTIDINLNCDLEKKIKEIGEIHFNMKPRFALLSSSELPEDFSTDIPESFSIKNQALDTESCSASIETFSEDSLQVNTNHSSFSRIQASLKCKEFTKMKPEKVVVSHIVSPSRFFVQRYSEIKKLKIMSDHIDKWCKSLDSRKSKVFTVETGDLYLVRYNLDNRWYRARVKSIHAPNDSHNEELGNGSPRQFENQILPKKDRETRVAVFYIDFGNTESVLLSDIKHIQARFLKLPGVAKECSLNDVLPANTVVWSQEAISTFTKFVKYKTLVMQTFEERNNVFQVDLCQVADNDVHNDVPMSVRDTLVFLELAVFPGGNAKHTNKSVKTEQNYMPPESLRVNAKICAIVSHVNSPSHLYVQQISTASYLANLIHEMNNTYNETNSMLHEIHVPHIGMACAAQFSIDKQWYRAKVIGLPGGGKVEVQYIDFGNSEVIHYKYLRKLFTRFLKLNTQAIPCKLANVTYNQATSWSKEVQEWLTKIVSRKQLTLQSIGTIPGENKAEIVLHYIDEGEDVCINTLMVELGLASSTGQIITPVRTKREVKVDSPKKPEISQSSPSIPPPVPAQLCDSDFTETNSGVVTEEISVSSPQKKKYLSLSKPPSSGADYIDVHVCHVESPGQFYIRIAGDNENKLNSLMDDLQTVYKSLDGELVDCSVGKAYAVFSKVKRTWFRGAVLDKLSDDKLLIHYVDYGNSEEVERKYIRKIVDKFTVDEAFSVRCHLDGIVPAGGSSQWPQTACDMFRRFVEPHDVLLLSSKGESDSERKSLPADLLVENVIVGGALEPTKIEHTSISAEIIKQGLGLPVRCMRTKSPPLTLLKEPEKEPPSCFKNISNDDAPPNCLPPETPDNLPEELTPAPLPNFQWKPVVPPFEPLFKGYVTNIGEDGSVHLYLLRDGTSQVDTISKALQFKYGREDFKPLKVPPTIGEACVARFSVDNQWYRAEVVSVYPGKVKVNFVDYGNNEIVPLSFLRTDIIMKAFPRQCLECSLHGISVGVKGLYDSQLLTFLHTQLVETEVSVEIQDVRDEAGRFPCVITTASGINIAELLLSMGFEQSIDDSISLPTPIAESEKTTVFASAQELKEGSLFPICVTQVNSETIVFLQLREFLEPKDDYERKLNETHNAFLELTQELRNDADNFPKLEEPMPGVPCCAKYSFDNNWYRCEITDLIEDGAEVLYVDYGNSEKIGKNDLRQLKNHFINFPVQLQFCELHGVKPVGSNWDPQVKELLVNKLMVPDQDLYAKVLVPGKISQVDLLVKTESGNYELAYQELIERNLIKLERHV